MSKKDKGYIPVMLTPFTESGAVDFSGLTKLTELYLGAGAAGLFANCQSSEMFNLSEEEQLAVTKQVLQVADGAVPVVATGTFGGPVEKQADFVKRMYETGVDAVIVITNMLAGESESADVFDERFGQLLDATPGIPLGFYECPEPFKRVLTAEQLKRFVSTGRVIYHKDTCLDIEQIRAKLDATKAVSKFGLYDAYMVHAVESLKAGSAGLSCIQGNYYPELVVWLCNHFDDDELADQVERVRQFFVERMDVMHAVYPIVAKYFLQKRGLPISTFTRKNAGVFDASVRGQIDSLYVQFQQLMEQIELKPLLA
ncbi:dihydrodipicolinate synthase family protein [Parapedobacter defluvii]|uniref:Dihydrodipicolinate synthase family protein n=1 Tax=Parapedobacter defluvii TaxID=2045106 RepID=A0ABQ1MAC2_9SPHI|nr:dihydrodipicolinate synthase family protein [Parapedobacter defluvii]RQP18578.1 MAG: dihydrodipicolinate synthase family protein [Parapedobacter sp.]GGC37557.1 dihydrodipicolinate synthase family protein [Parapedobacter defluvii]